MKKILLTLLITGVFFSCDERYDELNTEKKNPADVPGETLFTNGMREMFDMMVNTSVNENVFRLYAQYWAQTTYPDESAYNQVTREIPDNVWSNAYRDALKDMTEGRIKLEANPDPTLSDAHNANKLAVIDLNIAYTYSVLLELYGDVPFDEALDAENLVPKYDDGRTTYDKVITMLDNAISTLDTSEGSIVPSQDPVYGGDTGKWKMFGNSLKLRMGVMYFDDNPTKATTMINEALNSGVIAGSADNTAITYQAGPPSTNPLYEDLVMSGRKDFIVANTLVDALNDLNDPRIHVYATNPKLFSYDVDDNTGSKIDTTGTGRILIYPDGSETWMATHFTVLAADSADGMMVYKGGVYGTANAHAGNSHIGDMFFEPDLKGTIFSCTEMLFLLAEVAERGVALPKTAEEYYDEAILTSMAEWGVSDADALAYLARTDVAYTTADGGSGDWKQIIGAQAWLGLYNRGYEGWTTWRRLDFQGFNPPPGMVAADIPTRLLFPAREASLNGTNLAAAASNIGGDTKTTKLWWDKQ